MSRRCCAPSPAPDRPRVAASSTAASSSTRTSPACASASASSPRTMSCTVGSPSAGPCATRRSCACRPTTTRRSASTRSTASSATSGRPRMRLGGPRTAHPARAAAARRAHLGARPGHGQVRHGAAAHPDRRRARGARRHPQHRQPRPVRRGAHPGARRPGRLPRPAPPGCSATAGVLGYFGAERYAEVFQSLSDTPDRHAERYRRLHPGAPAQPPPDARHRPAPAAAARPTRGIPHGWGPRLGPA